MRHLVKIGHRKIGYLAGRKNVDVYRQRFEAYKDALESSGIEYREEYVYWSDWTQMGGYTQPFRPPFRKMCNYIIGLLYADVKLY